MGWAPLWVPPLSTDTRVVFPFGCCEHRWWAGSSSSSLLSVLSNGMVTVCVASWGLWSFWCSPTRPFLVDGAWGPCRWPRWVPRVPQGQGVCLSLSPPLPPPLSLCLSCLSLSLLISLLSLSLSLSPQQVWCLVTAEGPPSPLLCSQVFSPHRRLGQRGAGCPHLCHGSGLGLESGPARGLQVRVFPPRRCDCHRAAEVCS